MSQIDEQVEAFYGRDPLAGQNAVEFFLSHSDRSAWKTLFPLNASPGTVSPQVEIRLAKISAGIGEDSIPHLIKVLKEGSWGCKLAASPCFAGLPGSVIAKAELIGILESSDVDSQRLAIESLGFLGVNQCALDLIEFGKTGKWLPENPEIVSKYYFDKFYYYVLQALIRLTSFSKDTKDIGYCLRLAADFLDECLEHIGTSRTYDWDIRFVLHHLGPRAAEPIIKDWLPNNNGLISTAGYEALGRLKLNRTVPILLQSMDNPNLTDSLRHQAGVALSGFAHPRAAEFLAKRLSESSAFSPGLDWAFSTQFSLDIEWPDCSSLISQTLDGSAEVAAQMDYALAVRRVDHSNTVDRLLEKLVHNAKFERSCAAIALARFLGEDASEHLEGREEEAAEPLEHAMFLSALVHAGAYEKVDELHEVLQEVTSISLLRDVWKREVLYAFFVAEGDESKRGELWCEAAHTHAETVKSEMGKLIPDRTQHESSQLTNATEEEDRSDEASPVVREDHAVLLIHGIRTQAEWQQRVARAIEDNSDIRVIPTRYAFLDIIRFLWPTKSFRKRPVERIARLIRDESTRTNKISIIAHSFGTYIVSQILRVHADIKFHRVILCGSIIEDDYHWEHVCWRIAKDADLDWQVLNDCGMKDIWPVMAMSVTWGYGSSGRFGFGHNRVKDRFHIKGHSDFFSYDFARDMWLPYLVYGKIPSGEIDRPTNSWFMSILTVFKLKYVFVLALVAAIYFFATPTSPVVVNCDPGQLNALEYDKCIEDGGVELRK